MFVDTASARTLLRQFRFSFSIGLLCAALGASGGRAAPVSPVLVEPTVVRVEVARQPDGRFQLLRDGMPYVVRGVGGHGEVDRLLEAGGNTVRTWGIDALEQSIEGTPLLDSLHARNVAVIAGIWVQHERHGFDYGDPARVLAQRRAVREAVEAHRDHPAILLWGLGNEVEAFRGDADDTPIWRELDTLAGIVKEADPTRPVLTAVAGLTPRKVRQILRHMPKLDILGVNAYAGAIACGAMLAEEGWDRPFILTEFGPPGPWEVARTSWGAPIEPSSEDKARGYAATQAQATTTFGHHCLGTCAFLWGAKHETTATWFGMFLATGEKLPAVDAMTLAWSGREPPVRCPELLAVDFPGARAAVAAGSRWSVSARARDPQGLPLQYAWEVVSEQTAHGVGGEAEDAPPSHPDAVLASDGAEATIRAPAQPGGYRLFVTVRNTGNSATVTNVPFLVE
jgi:hypothetical protein